MSKTPKQYKDKITKYAKKLGKSPSELEKQLSEAYKFLSNTVKDKSESTLWRMAYSRWFGTLRRETGSVFSPAPTWTGFIIGETGLMDFIEIMKRKAEYLYNDPNRREKALADMLVDRNGTPLDPREKINYGRDENPNFGRPFPEDEHSYYRALYGVASKGTELLEDDLQFFRYNINDDNAVNVTYPVRTLAQFRANARRRPKYGFLDLNAISNKEVMMSPVKGDIPDVIERLEITTWKPYSMDDLDTVYGMYKDDKSVPVLLFANVATINPEVNTKTGNRTLWVDDIEGDFDKPGIALFLPGNIPIEFGLDSKVLFVGRVDKIGGAEDARIVFQAFGYYAPPDYLLPMTEEY